MARKICLSGFAEMSREFANQQPSGTEIWGMNEGHAFLKKKPSRWFQIHPRGWNPEMIERQGWDEGNYGRHPAHVNWLAEQTCPVYQQEIDPRIPMSVKYPMDKILKKYRRYITSTIAYMLALVLYEHEQYRWWKPWTRKMKVDSIVLTGIEMSLGTEYMIQRPCVEYFLGKLETSGIKIGQHPKGTSILHSEWLYAIDHIAPILEGELIPILAKDLIGPTSDIPIVEMMEKDDSPYYSQDS